MVLSTSPPPHTWCLDTMLIMINILLVYSGERQAVHNIMTRLMMSNLCLLLLPPSCLFCCFSHLAGPVLTGRCLTLQSQTSAQQPASSASIRGSAAPSYLLDSSELSAGKIFACFSQNIFSRFVKVFVLSF